MSKYNLKHLFIIIALIITSGIGLLWFFHEYMPNPYPNSETYLLLAIYLIMLSVTAFVYGANNFIQLHKQMGFHKFPSKYTTISIFVGVSIWALDFYFQKQLMNVNITAIAKEWANNKNLTIAFATTVVFAPLIEEILFRGIFLKTISTYLSNFLASLLVSSIFVLVHGSLIDAPSLFLAANLYAWLTFKTKSIVPAIIAHLINNFLTFVYYLSLT